jgi:hypothetical protein
MKQQTLALTIAATAILGAVIVLSFVVQTSYAQPLSLRIDDVLGVESSEKGLSIDIVRSLLEPRK